VDNKVRNNDINNSHDDDNSENNGNTVAAEIGCPMCRCKLPSSSSFPSIVDMQKLPPPPLQPAAAGSSDGGGNSVLVDDDDNNRALRSFEYACQSGNFSALVAHLDNGADVNSKFEVNNDK
jgi:hypothetical protein